MHVHVFLKLFVKYSFLDAPLSLELKIFMIDQSLKLADDNNTKVVNKLFLYGICWEVKASKMHVSPWIFSMAVVVVLEVV